MSHLWLAKWPNGDIVLARADSHAQMVELLDEQADPGAAQIAEYLGPLTLEFKAKLPGRALASAEYLRLRGAPRAALP